MRDKAHVGFINPHTERYCGDHDHIFGCHKIGLRLHPRFWFHSGMIKPRRSSRFGDQCRQFFGAVARGGIDNTCPGPAPDGRRNRRALVRRIGHSIANIGPVKSRHNHTVRCNPQLLANIGARVRVGGRGQREPRHIGEIVHQWTQQAIIGAEIMPPFGHAMGLVYRKQGDPCFAQ